MSVGRRFLLLSGGAALASPAQAGLFRRSGGGGPVATTAIATISTSAELLGGQVGNGSAQTTLLNALHTAGSNCGLAVTVDGQAVNVTGINLSATASLATAATAIQTAINAALSGAAVTLTFLTTPNLASNTAFYIYSNSAGTGSSITAASPPTGATDISALLLLTSGTMQYTNNGSVTTVNEATGTSLGTYVDPVTSYNPSSRFSVSYVGVQKAINSATTNFTALFCRDVGGGRIEVVFHCGSVFNAAASAARNLPPYTVTVTQGGVTLLSNYQAGTSVAGSPGHWFYSQWRWQWTAGSNGVGYGTWSRPITVSTATLISNNMIPNYANSVGSARAATTPPTASYAGPMSAAGITTDWNQAGDDNGIGPITNWQAYYVCNNTGIGDSGHLLSTVMSQAEASGSAPFHYRDEATMAPVDLTAHTGVTIVVGGSPTIVPANYNPFGGNLSGSHEPSLVWLAFLLTGDPYFLMEQQFEGIFGQTNYKQPGGYPLGGRFTAANNIRLYAWSFRSVMQATAGTPASGMPSCFLPQSALSSLLGSCQTWLALQANMTATDSSGWGPSRVNFQSIVMSFGANDTTGDTPNGSHSDFWEEDYCRIVFGWCALMLPSSTMTTIVNWVMQSIVARTNGTSGWLRDFQSSLNYAMADLTAVAAAGVGQISGASLTLSSVTSGAFAVGQVIAVGPGGVVGNVLASGLTIISGSGLSWTLNKSSGFNVSAGTTISTVNWSPNWSDLSNINLVVYPDQNSTTAGGSGVYPPDPGALSLGSTPGGQVTYASIAYAALAVAVACSITGASTSYTWMSGATGMNQSGPNGTPPSSQSIDWKWRIAS